MQASSKLAQHKLDQVAAGGPSTQAFVTSCSLKFTLMGVSAQSARSAVGTQGGDGSRMLQVLCHAAVHLSALQGMGVLRGKSGPHRGWEAAKLVYSRRRQWAALWRLSSAQPSELALDPRLPH